MATLDRMNPVLLAFDTSTEALAVALQGPGGQRLWNGEGGAQASALLLPTVQQLLDEAGLQLVDVDAIAFGQGPGAFTGLRTACAVAQGLAFGADKPVLAIDSLLIVAEDARADQGFPPVLEVAVAMDARMGELYAARYRWAAQGWQVLQAPGLWDPQAWAILGRAEAARGRRTAQHAAVAEQYALSGAYAAAVEQLTLARAAGDADFMTLSKIDARLTTMRAMLRREQLERAKSP